MKKCFAIALFLLSLAFQGNAQTRGIKVGYIDMEYILQNVPDYTEAKNQLEQKAQRWKQDIEAKKIEIAKLKDALKTERALLTRELIDEREEEIKFQESELLDFQQKKFGPNGDLITQKAVLVKPIQDQVFNAVQDIAELKKYDYVFDKSSDLTMLFAAKRHDISDQVIRAITRAERREQLSKKELKEQEKKEYQEDVEDENPALAARKKALEEKKAQRDKLVADRKAAAEARKKEQEEKRKQAAAEKEAKKNGTVPATDKTAGDKPAAETNDKSSDSSKTSDPKADKAAARAKLIEDKKKALEERKKKILEEREAAKKAKEEKSSQPKTE
ncbi:OmpH family outer membrane protein [Flavobacterium sedimenticola]|uniref:OmpH family outer membrane protein n=1 Tax=Flavobacterium sedimenticola TaxID=3043286 RepID=A0ABT6XRK6_9FLAO|nr:OmpH family outer membrane protein [Flavobacterium sedimenticola]MDI9257724.1 OmpH family outer membrane protein [Flavobacterium sedimenticola]